MCVPIHTEIKLLDKNTSYVTITLHLAAEGSSQHCHRPHLTLASLHRSCSSSTLKVTLAGAGELLGNGKLGFHPKINFFFPPLTAVHRFACIVQIAQIYIFTRSHIKHRKKDKKVSLS